MAYCFIGADGSQASRGAYFLVQTLPSATPCQNKVSVTTILPHALQGQNRPLSCSATDHRL